MGAKPVTVRDPRTRREWQEAADMAEGLLALDAARKYGLVYGGVAADIERCVRILDRAARKGIRPRHDAAAWFVAVMLTGGEEG
jgi:TPR repeat protein